MTDNPRQLSSLDSSDLGLNGSLTNRPPSGVPAGEPIDLGAINRRVIYNRTTADYNYKESDVERALRLEREAEASRRIKQETADTNEKNRLLLEKEQAQRNELRNRMKPGQPDAPEVNRPAPETPLNKPSSPSPQNPRTSPASPPPTLNASGARANALIEPTATPMPALQRQPVVSQPGGLPFDIPTPPPQMGRLLIPGAGAAIVSGGARAIAGQPLPQVIAGGLATGVGTIAGGLIGGAVAGPVGAFVGSTIGGFVAGAFVDSFFHSPIPSPAQVPFPVPNYPPFVGGQEFAGLYQISWQEINTTTGELYQVYNDTLFGPISAPKRDADGWYVECSGSFNESQIPHGGSIVRLPIGRLYNNCTVTNITKIANGISGGGDLPGYHAPPPDNRPGYYNDPPLNTDNAVPSGSPGAGKNKGVNRDVAPSRLDSGSPRGAGNDWVPGGYLAPGLFPSPEASPSNLGGMLPSGSQAPLLPMFADPGDVAIPSGGFNLSSPSGGTSSGGFSGTVGNPLTVDPLTSTPLTPTDLFAPAKPAYSSRVGSRPSSTPSVSPSTPVADANSPVPKSDTQPKTPTAAESQAAEQKKDFDDQIKRLTAIATAIAALTPAIQGLPDAIANNPKIRQARREDVETAVCDISQPGACLGSQIQKATDAANNNGTKLDGLAALLAGLNTAGNAAQLALLNIINGKLGEQLPGGIGGKLSRFADWMHLDRVLNIMILATTIHNGLMLSNDIGQTLLGIINNALTLIGLKKEDGSSFDIGSIISGSIENLIKGAIGSENYQQLSTAWQKANRVYQATTNVLNQLMNVNSVITNALEVIGSYTGKIGNALRIWGVIGEKAYSWMNPQPSFDNQWITKLQQLQEGANTVAMVAQIPVDTVNAVTELNNSATEFVKAVQQEPDTKSGIDVGEAAKVKTERDAAKTVSYVPAFDISDLFDADD